MRGDKKSMSIADSQKSRQPIIQVKNVSMRFNLMEEKVDTLKEYVMKLLRGKIMYNEFLALDNVSFSVNQGDVFALVGFNGAGKSTMLKLIAGVLQPTEGSVKVQGKIAPLIEVGAGFDPDLTARENIYLNGALLGHKKAYLDEHFNDIIAFAELEKFVDVPVKNFSSGMYARLGFAIATESRPDILIVDEVLSVGDYQFQEKCHRRISEMIAQGTTVLMVSHDINTIKSMCTKAAWFDHGKLVAVGPAQEICERYQHIP